MLNRLDYLNTFMRDNEYPKEAIECLGQAYHKICLNTEAADIFEQTLQLYESDKVFDYTNWLKKMGKVAEICEISVESAELLLVLSMSKHLKEKYELHGIDMQIYKDTCMDFKAKLMECHDVRGVWGTFVGFWFDRFFNLTRFAIGRLQYEIISAYTPAEAEYGKIAIGDPVVNVHIPSLGPLKEEDCRASFLAASKFFAPAFKGGVVPFVCSSWLLAPEHREMLKPDSNILKFMNFFSIRLSESTVEKNLWRIFNKDDCSDVDTLPADNSLRRAYIKAIKEDKMPHIGVGLFYVKDMEFFK